MKIKEKTAIHLRKAYGEWALVTGATSGIGMEMAKHLASAGFNLVITGRREEKLTQLATQLFDSSGCECIPMVGDLSEQSHLKQLMDETSHLPIGIAILNAGFGTSGPLADSSLETEINLIDLNCKQVLVLSHHFTRKMKLLPNRGALVLMSSLVGFQGTPYAANYAASKAYVQSLGEALAVELKQEKIDLLVAAPGPVETGFAKRANMQMGKSLSPKTVSKEIIEAIGKRSTILPGFMTKFLRFNLRLTPRWAKVRIMGKVMSGFTAHQSA